MDAVTVSRTRHGPFERIQLIASGEGLPSAEVSVYRLGDLLVDAGGSRFAAAIVAALRETPPRRIVCTHQHEDHVGGIGALRRAFGAIPVHAPRAHVELLRGPATPRYRAVHWGTPEPVDDALPYDAGEVFQASDVALEAVATPGHTPGHVALVARWRSETFALSGDLYARPTRSVWFESANDDLIRSCRTLAALASPLRLLPTHGRVREDGDPVLCALADARERQAAEIVAASERLGTRDAGALVRQLYGGESPSAVGSGGEFSRAALVRSVLDPVRELPARPLPIGEPVAPTGT